MDSKDFLGRGWKFPISVDKKTGRFEMSEYEEDIAEAIAIIIQTRRGERVMMADFGCDIHNYIFGLTDYGTLSEMEKTVQQALIRWEPRIKNIKVKAKPIRDANGRVDIEINYTVRSTNNAYNRVYPFYLNEGIGIG